MAFWKSDDEKRREIEELKKQVEGRDSATGLPEPPKPPEPPAEKPLQGPEPRSDVEFEEPSIRIKQQPRRETRHEPAETRGPVEEDVAEDIQEAVKDVPHEGPEDDSAPLFVKIDKYRDVIQDLEMIRGSLDDLTRLFELMNEVDHIKRKGMDQLRNGLAELTDTLVSMDEKFIRPEGTGEIVSEPETGVSKTVKDLKNDLRNIRDSLDRLG